jgi:hypothetical protein
MTPTTTSPGLAEIIARRPATERAHYLATRDALLEHARMGRSVSEWRDGRIVDVSPAEVFARYGLDEFGRPPAGGDEPRRSP